VRKTGEPSASVFDTLERLKSYTEFETVKVSPDGSVEVKYAQRATTDKGKKSAKPILTAIDSLGQTHPVFAFGK
jgi:hypothetical protein